MVNTGLSLTAKRGLTDRFEEKLEFYKGWFAAPKVIGAIAPTGNTLASRMASVVRSDSRLPVLELGPGNGAITRAILERGIAPANLVSVEYCMSFLPGLGRRYPGVRFVHGDAFNTLSIARDLGVENFDVVISALPLLNFPLIQRVRFVDKVLDLIEPGQPLVQFSYGPRPPVPAHPKRYVVNCFGTVLRNLPPARIWVYRRSPVTGSAATLECTKRLA